MEALIDLMQKHSTGKVVASLFVLTMAVYLTMLLYSIPAVTAFAPQLPIFDLSPFGYSFNYATDLLNALGVEGRNLYLSTQLPLDFIYPGLFSVNYSLLLVWLLGKIYSEDSNVYYFVFVPFLAGVFDYFENVFIIKMITSFPDIKIATVKVASFFTLLKSSFTMLFFLLLIFCFALLLKQKVLSNRK